MPSHGPGLASLLLAGAFSWARGKRHAGVPPPEVAAQAPVALFLTGGASVRWANAAAERLTGRTQEQLLGSDFFGLLGLEPPDGAHESRRMVLWTDGAGNRRWLDVATSRCSSGGEPGFVAVALDVTQQKEEEERILFRATHDELTGLPNRLLLVERLGGAMASAKRRARAMAVLSLDLHRFRAVNDTMGYAVGDRLLQEMATRLRSSVRESDVVARVDADRFVILLTEMSDAGDVGQVARKILALVAEPIRLEGTEVSLSASIGIALHPAERGDAEDLLRRADLALSRAKDQGPGSIELSNREETTSRALERLAIENGLRHAIQRDQLVLFYQPVIGLRSGRTEGVEALLRWQRTDGPLTKPAQFIGLAEESRLIVPIGGWVLRTACSQARAWHDRGWTWLNVAVNVSAAQFQEPDLVESIERTLAETGLPPERLELEITESVAMKNIDLTVTVLQRLRNMGIGVAIDDFGTGHSSLSYLRRFPITKVKIDGSFVREVLTDRNDAAIVTAIVTMARDMGLTTVAEGVETPGQLAFLARLGCDEVQGFVLAQPSAEQDVAAWFDGKHVAEALAGLAAQAADAIEG